MKYDLQGPMPDSLWAKIKGMPKPELEDALRVLANGVRNEERERIVALLTTGGRDIVAAHYYAEDDKLGTILTADQLLKAFNP